MTDIEAVARELCLAAGRDPDDMPYDRNTKNYVYEWTLYKPTAEVAIATLQELGWTPPGANPPDGWRDEPISEEWLSEIGFKYRDPEPRQPFRHWLIGFDEHDDHGLYVETTKPGWFNRAGEHVNADAGWFLWIGRDSQHIHVRPAFTKSDIVSVIEGLSGQPFDPAKVKYGRVPVALPQPPEVK